MIGLSKNLACCFRATGLVTCAPVAFGVLIRRMSTVETLVGAEYEGRYAIESVLSISPMGTLFKATQLAVARPVCVRVMNPLKADAPETVERFKAEARKLASFSHANVIDLIDFGQDSQGRLFQVREYLEGERLHQLIEREAPLPAARVKGICVQVLDALAEAHAQGIVHRDLNPRNIFVTKIGSRNDFIKLLEFRLSHGEDRSWTESESDKPHYTPPELLSDSPLPVDDRSDLYALGCILYELLTGHVPFPFKTPEDVRRAHLNDSPPPPYVKGKALTGPLVELITRCLEKSPDNRPEDAAEALAVLQSSPNLGHNGPASEHHEAHRRMGTGPLLRHHTTTIKHSGSNDIALQADCEMPGANGSGTFEYRPRRRILPFVIGGTLFAGLLLAVLVLFGDKLGLQPATPDEVRTDPTAEHAAADVTLSPATADAAAPETAETEAAQQDAGAADDGAPQAPEVDAAPPKKPTRPVAVKIKLTTKPSGATVVNAASNRPVTKTPAELQFASDRPPVLRIELAGYKSVELPLSADSKNVELILEKLPSSKGTTTKPQGVRDRGSIKGVLKAPKKKKKPRTKKKRKVRGVKDLL